ncbi:MAG: precorrin-8X methylmutase [Lachnospiraceae bacterium]|nr:precorrin-8X methylmutase [Lachnospiraceae bacterium]
MTEGKEAPDAKPLPQIKKTFKTPAEIEAESMRLIEEELSASGFFKKNNGRFSRDSLPFAVIRRVIHATADFSFAENLCFAEESGLYDCFRSDRQDGANVVVCDTNMLLAGINKPALERHGLTAVCYMSDPETVEAAQKKETTRAVVSMERAAARFPAGIYAVGNAPTALTRIAGLIEEGKLAPALLIGVPVGFVNVVESKEHALKVCHEKKIPAILSMGRKGGSTVAAAIVNALLYYR